MFYGGPYSDHSSQVKILYKDIDHLKQNKNLNSKRIFNLVIFYLLAIDFFYLKLN